MTSVPNLSLNLLLHVNLTVILTST